MHSVLSVDEESSLQRFLRVAFQFRLGDLVTESSHPLTEDLSENVNSDPEAAVEGLRSVDLSALKELSGRISGATALATSIRDCLAAGHRLFLGGCGATGRLAISLEVFARRQLLGELPPHAVQGFMAGGDCALIRSIESFEDYPGYGGRMLRESGFSENDLFLGITEGGETPYVIGATEEAAVRSRKSPWFLYCNPDDLLSQVAERSERVLQANSIQKLNLTVGPMAITGSTRMQASTVQMATVGWCVEHRDNPSRIPEEVASLQDWLQGLDLSPLTDFFQREASVYEMGGFLLYESAAYDITVLTDTTERSPTFSLTPFENQRVKSDPPSLSYLHLPGTPNSDAAWRKMLGREPRTLEWPDLKDVTGRQTLLGFDFSDRVQQRRAAIGKQSVFQITDQPDSIRLKLENLVWEIPASGRSPFQRQLLVKMILNMQSTLVMGRLKRFRGNIMTWVKPTNHKLCDRAIRFIQMLLGDCASHYSYEEIARELFHQQGRCPLDQSVVLRTVEALTED